MGKVGPPCTVCMHPKRAQIEIALTLGLGTIVLSRCFGIPDYTLRRHRRLHLTPAARAAYLAAMKPSEIDLEALTRSESESLLANFIASRARLSLLSQEALEKGDTRTAILAERSVIASLHEVAQLLGVSVQKHETRHLNVLVSPDYLRLRHAIIDALRRHPGALKDVTEALAELESKKAEEIVKTRPLLIEVSPC
jgi:hypothetical protein